MSGGTGSGMSDGDKLARAIGNALGQMGFGFLEGHYPGESEGVRGRFKEWLAGLLTSLAEGEFKEWATKPLKSWAARLAMRLEGEIEEDKFDKKQLRNIRNAVREQLNSPGQWIDINGFLLPRPGHIFRLKEDARYGIVRGGSLILVKVLPITKRWLMEPEKRARVTVLKLDSEGKLTDRGELQILVKDLEPVQDEENIIKGWRNAAPPQNVLCDGEAVELAKEVVFSQQSQQEAVALTLPKGLQGVIDEPKLKKGLTLDELNFLHQSIFETEVEIEILLASGDMEEHLGKGKFRVATVANDIYSVYVPYYQQNIQFKRSDLKRREFDKEMFDRVVMSEKTRNKILSLVEGDEETLDKWGIDDNFQRGKGKVILFYGPPGCGKTETGRALGERLHRPVYYADISDFGNSMESFEKGLKTLIEKTERWGAVTVVNEAEVILEARRQGNPFDVSMRIAAVLRNLEKLDRGILCLTTNRSPTIDFAIESRLDAQFYFPYFTKEQRKQVWRVNLPDKLSVPKFKECLDDLAKISLDGRQISNVISNAATQASREGLDSVPVEYLFNWANDIIENQKIRKKAEQDQARQEHGEIGFPTPGKD